MKKIYSIYRYIPIPALRRLNDALQDNPPFFKYDKDCFYFVLDLFFRLPSYNKNLFVKENGYIAIAHTYFNKYITGDHSLYTHYLIHNEIIDCDWEKSIGNHICYGYLLNSQSIGSLTKIEISPNGNLRNRIIANVNKRDKKRMEPHIKGMKKWFKKLRVDKIKANDYLIKLVANGRININQYHICLMCLSRIEEQDFSFKRNKTNYRLDTNLTNIMKELRQFITIDGVNEALYIIDLINSQPFLLCYLILLKYEFDKNKKTEGRGSGSEGLSSSSIQETIQPEPLKCLSRKLLEQIHKCPQIDDQEMKKYMSLTVWGKIYDYFETSFGVSRDEAKIIFMGIFYSKNWYSNFEEEKRMFEKEFPSIYKMIVYLKKTNYKEFPVTLQTVESEFFLDKIGKSLFEKLINILTIHDSYIVTESQLEETKKTMNEVFMNYFGVVPELKIERINPDKLFVELETQEPFRFMIKEKYDPYYPKLIKPQRRRREQRLRSRNKPRSIPKSFTNFELMMKKNQEFRKRNVQLN